MSSNDSGLRFQADEKPPLAISLGLGFQLTALSVSATILLTTVVMRAAGQSEVYLSWAVFAAVAIGGAVSMLRVPTRAFRYGPCAHDGQFGSLHSGLPKALAGAGSVTPRVYASDFNWLGKSVRAESCGVRGRRNRSIPREGHHRVLRLLRFQCADG